MAHSYLGFTFAKSEARKSETRIGILWVSREGLQTAARRKPQERCLGGWFIALRDNFL